MAQHGHSAVRLAVAATRSRFCAALVLVAPWLWLAGCAQAPSQPAPVEPPPPPPAPSKMESQPLKHLKGRTIKPQPTRPLNVRSRCTHRDAVGTRTSLNLQVKNAEVKTFDARVDIPKRGACRFNLKDFKQVATLPNVLLATKNGSGCTVRMWEQGPRVTIAFNNCPASCEGQAFDYLWPIMVEAKSGRCF